MKIWIVKIGVNSRTFFDELSFNAWLSITTDAVSNKVVEVYEATPVERKIGPLVPSAKASSAVMTPTPCKRSRQMG